MSAVIEVKDVSKSFFLAGQEVKILHNLTFDIHQGEFVSLMGPSGSGKSTLLYLMGGLDKPTSGEVFIGGTSLNNLSDKQESIMRRREIGFVFQFYNLIPNLNLEENILLPLLLDGKKAKDYKNELDEILELVGLLDRRKHTPKELSGGQQQRVAIARALIGNPNLILADEPIGNLDSVSGTGIMELFQKIQIEKNKTIVQVTHSIEAADYGTRTINLKDGRIS